jgi:hypothetical protein
LREPLYQPPLQRGYSIRKNSGGEARYEVNQEEADMDWVEKLAITLYGDIGPNEWDEVDEDSKDMCRFNVRRLLSCLEEEGMVVVPREPTEEMLTAGAYDEYSGHTEMAAAITWRAMLAAAPNPSPSSASA